MSNQKFEVWNTPTKELLFLEEAPDLEIAIKRAKNTIRLNTNFDDIDTDNIFVCAASGENNNPRCHTGSHATL